MREANHVTSSLLILIEGVLLCYDHKLTDEDHVVDHTQPGVLWNSL